MLSSPAAGQGRYRVPAWKPQNCKPGECPLTLGSAQYLSTDHRFELLIDSIADYAIYMLDPSGVVSNWNTGAERLKGYTRGRDRRSSFLAVLYGRRPHQGAPCACPRRRRPRGAL
jgi:PAS domain-containing protein